MKAKLLLILGVIFCTKIGFSSEKKLMTIIINDINTAIISYDKSPACEEIIIYDSITKERIYSNDLTSLIEEYVELIKIDTIEGWNRNSVPNSSGYYHLYIINIRINHDWYSGFRYRPDTLTYDTLTYVILVERFPDEYYKIFGFYNTNIKMLGKEQFSFVINNMLKGNLLSKKESRYYKKSILKGKDVIHRKVNRPCEYFNYFYKNNNYEPICTIILKESFLDIPRMVTGIRLYYKCW
jgi:hypothetical protein